MLRWEVERSRVALTLLRRKLGIQGLQELLSDENSESDREHERWLDESKGEWVASSTQLEVKGLKLQEFLGWFHERVKANDQVALGLGCPEHYVVTPTADGRMDVVETTGGWGSADSFLCEAR